MIQKFATKSWFRKPRYESLVTAVTRQPRRVIHILPPDEICVTNNPSNRLPSGMKSKNQPTGLIPGITLVWFFIDRRLRVLKACSGLSRFRIYCVCEFFMALF